MTSQFTRFVEIGRVVLINYGTFEGKLAVIIDVIDQNRALVSGPEKLTGVPRHSISFKRISLTDIKISVPRGVRQKGLIKCFTEQKVQEQWDKTAWAKKRAARVKRANLTDFDRFKVMIAKKKKSYIVNEARRKLVKANNKK